ncbi:MAG: FAD-dependent oxidoreductase [Nocardioidaceae bacterium]
MNTDTARANGHTRASGSRYRHVLSSVHVGPLTLRNRVVSTPHQTGLVYDHLPTADLAAYHGERARGGIGAVFVEASAVHPSGLLTPHTIGAYMPDVVPAMAKIAETVHAEGAGVFVQLFHGGREQIAAAPREPALAPSAIPSSRFHVEPRALSQTEIDELISGYGTSARHVAAAGFDGVEVSAAHAYLPAQFLSARSNARTDEYNGDLRARLLFLTRVLERVRQNVGDDRAVGVRLSLDELSPDGLDREKCLEVSRALCESVPIDFLSFALGDSASYQGSAFIAPAPPVPADVVLEFMAGVREQLPGRPTVLATTRVLTLDSADHAVAAGLTDLVGMTRAHIAEPHLVRKALAGQPTIPCIGCNQGCIGHYHAGLPIACVTNIRTGRENGLGPRPDSPVAGTGHATLIIGGGPAGVAAAMEAAEEGHQVDLVEKSDCLGGQLRIAGKAPGHAEMWQSWHSWAASELARLGVNVQLCSEATSDTARGYDLVVVATGAEPYRPSWADSRDVPLLDGWAALNDPESIDGPVLIADWGGEPTGLDAAEVLAKLGRRVTLAYAGQFPGQQIHQYQRNGYLARLDELNVTILPHQEIAADGKDGLVLRHSFSGRSQELPGHVRTIVLAHGRRPVNELWHAWESDPRTRLVGDAAAPRGLEEATLEGARAVRPVPAP